MMPVHLLHRGHLEVDALWFDAGFLGEAEARRRLLVAWRPGCRVQRLRGGYLLQFPSLQGHIPIVLENTRRIDASEAPGLPLRAQKEGYTALELPKNAPAGPLVWAQGGTLVAETPGETVDPGSWLDLGPMQRGQSLGRPPPPPALTAPVAVVDLRAKAGVPVDPRTAELLAALAEKTTLTIRPPATWAQGWLGSLLRSLFPRNPPPGQRMIAGPGEDLQPRPPSLLRQRWLDFLLRSGLYGFIQNRQEEYLRELFSAFEDGDLQDALRRAIPLADSKASPGAPLAAGTPQPRDSLRMTPGGAGASVLPLEDQVREALKAHYRKAVQRLLDEGRVDEAVFVLSELLRDHEGAVTTLERAGRWEDAAKLAELRGLDVALQVRLWLEAGSEARAIAIARQAGVFSPVVSSLERNHPELGRRLRRLWARSFADRGAVLSAVQVLWENPTLRAEALPLLKELEHGDFWTEALPYHLSLEPGAREAATRRLREGGNNLSVETLRRLAAGLQRLQAPEQQGLQRGLQRMLAARGRVPEGPLSTLMLRTLCPPPDPPVPLEAPVIRLSRPGLRPLADGILRGERLWVALGEEGVEEWDHRGRKRHVFPVPTQRLIADQTGEQALSVMRRGERLVISHLDLVRRKHNFLIDLRADHYSMTFDGQRWFVSCGDELYALDATDPGRVLWRVQLPGTILALSQDETFLAVWTRSRSGEEEGWVYQHASMILRSRTPGLPVQGQKAPLLAVVQALRSGIVLTCQRPGESLQSGISTTAISRTVTGIYAIGDRVGLVQAGAAHASPHTRLSLYRVEPWQHNATVLVPGANAAWIRRFGNRLLLGSDCGQLAVVDEQTLELLWELRM